MEAIGSILTGKRRFAYSRLSIIEPESAKAILVVDNSEDIRELLSVLLHDEGIVDTAVNGLDALSRLAGRHFDVVVSDIEMPFMNGIELHRNVQPVYKDSFLFFSGTMKREYISYLLMNNLTLFRKPDDFLKLQSAVHRKLYKPCSEIITERK